MRRKPRDVYFYGKFVASPGVLNLWRTGHFAPRCGKGIQAYIQISHEPLVPVLQSMSQGEKRTAGFDFGKVVKHRRIIDAPPDNVYSVTVHNCIGPSGRETGNFLSIIGIPNDVDMATGTIKHMLKEEIAEALLEEDIHEPKEKIPGFYMHILSMAHFDKVVEGLHSIQLIKHFGPLQVNNRAALNTKTPPIVNLSYNDVKMYYRLDGRAFSLKLFLAAYGFEFLDPNTMERPIRDESSKKWLSTGYWLLKDQSGSDENKKVIISDLNRLFNTCSECGLEWFPYRALASAAWGSSVCTARVAVAARAAQLAAERAAIDGARAGYPL